MTNLPSAVRGRAWPSYNVIWRWHFYAGLFCLPFVMLLAVTGGIYLFKPQYEAAVYSSYDHLSLTGQRASAAAQVQAALAAVPGSVLNAYELPKSPDAAVRVRVGKGTEVTRVYVHPETLAILKQEVEDQRFMRVVHRLHGELLLGDRGSLIVELAASWAIVMFITGLYLWWPRAAQGLAGVVYPRLGRGRRIFWRDLHAVTGLWIAFFVLFLLISGLPWAKSWGGLLKELRQTGSTTVVKQDWGTSRSAELRERTDMNTQVAADEHAGHQHGDDTAKGNSSNYNYSAIDRLLATVQPLHLTPPVLIAPPSAKSPDWTARSDAQNRPLRVNLVLDAQTGAIRSRQNFSDRLLLDRIIGVGVAAHEGQLFGWSNQALGAITALGLLLMCVSSIVIWWRRRDPGILGAPRALPLAGRFSLSLIALIVILGIVLPLLGVSLILVMLAEHWVLRRIPATRDFLGLGGLEMPVVDARLK
jgi:uncharacterized iron-regulated membrane protein